MPNIIQISDFNNPKLDVYARTSEGELLNRCEPEKGMFIAESPLVIERALNSGYEPVSILMEEKHIDNQGKEILKRCNDIPVYTAKFDVLTQLTGFKLTRGMLCAMKRKKMQDVESICKNASRIAVLEDVMNPTNVGAIFRSAAALNIDAVILSSSCSNPLYRRAIRVSMGNVFLIPWTYINEDTLWPEKGMKLLKNMGFKTVSMALKDDSVSIDDEKIKNEEKLAIILGTEGTGLTDYTISESDYTVKIPMVNGVDSLNVAAASAIAFWELTK